MTNVFSYSHAQVRSHRLHLGSPLDPVRLFARFLIDQPGWVWWVSQVSVLIAILNFVLGAITGGILASGVGAILYAIVCLFRGRLGGLLALLWPALVWYFLLPLLLLGIGTLGDHWGYKFQIFALIGAGLSGLGNLFIFSLAAYAAATSK